MAAIKAARAKIEEAIKTATMKSAGRFGNNYGALNYGKASYDTEIKAATRLWRESWIIGPLMQALVDIDPCPVCKGNGYSFKSVIGKGNGCEPCKGSGIKGGLNFDPYQMSQEAAQPPAGLRLKAETE